MEALPSNPQDYAAETALAQRVARIFGYSGLTIEVREGAGWQTTRDEHTVTLVVDPTMLSPQTIKDASGNELPQGIKAPEQYSIYGIAHELGHIDDFMQPESDLTVERNMKPSEQFFWNVLDDGVINKRLRNIPLLNSLTEEIYADILFPVNDYTQLPKHVQFMYGWLLTNVTPQRSVQFAQDVQQALDGLQKVKVNNRKYDLYRTLSHPSTAYGKRCSIARDHILPIYEAFLEEDKHDDQSEQAENQQSNSSDGLDNSGQKSNDNQSGETTSGELYEAYAEASHCGHHKHQHEDSGPDPHEAVKEAAEAMAEIQEEQAATEANNGQQTQSGEAGKGAGAIANELQLSPEDAGAYQKAIEEYRTQIKEVGMVLQQLTVPSIEYTSPRYRRHVNTSGLKLSPRDLFNVVVAKHSDIDPAVWNPVETVSKKEGFSFNGLDIHLVVDASGSMGGQKAESAAACSIILMEGIAAARRIVERQHPGSSKPDVRLQVMVFGGSARVVAPLAYKTEAKDKGVAFTTVRAARDGSTIVSDALQKTVRSSRLNPERTQLVYLISDGDFSDASNAISTIRGAGTNYYLCQYILQSPGTHPITTQSSHLSNPQELPAYLNKQLHVVAQQFLS